MTGSQSQESVSPENVGVFERVASAAAGSLLVARALRQRSPLRIAGALVGADLLYRGITGRCQIYGALGVNTNNLSKAGSDVAADAPVVQRTVTIGRSADDLYAMWRDTAQLALVMSHFAEVSETEKGVTHWRVRGPLKRVFEWDSPYTTEEPGRELAWESRPGTQLPNHGRVVFRPAPNSLGTEVTVSMRFQPPLGAVGSQITKAFHLVPRSITGSSLRRFKSLAETGEIPTLANNSSARGRGDQL